MLLFPESACFYAPCHAKRTQQGATMPTEIPNRQIRGDRNRLPDRVPRRNVSDSETQQALSQIADAIDDILKYLNNVLGASK